MGIQHGEMGIGRDVAYGVDVRHRGMAEGELVDGDLRRGREPGAGDPLGAALAARGVDVQVDGGVLGAVVEADGRLAAVGGWLAGFDALVVHHRDAQVAEIVFRALAYFGAAFARQAREELGRAAEESDFLAWVCGCDFACGYQVGGISQCKCEREREMESEESCAYRLFLPLRDHRRR